LREETGPLRPEWCRLCGQNSDYWPASRKLQASSLTAGPGYSRMHLERIIMITEEEYRNIMTDVYRKIITAVNIETGDDGSKAHEVLKVFHELLRMDEKQYKKQQKFYG